MPHEANPKRGFTFSWNNSQAPGWTAADGQWGHGSIHRGKLLEDEIRAQKPHSITPVRLVQMMEKAGLTDLRGRYVAPLALELLEEAQPGPREQAMIGLLKEWIAEGALRRDGDGNGDYDRSAAVAIMDAWWEPLLRGIFDPVLGDSARIPITFDNAPSSGGSAYESGFYPHVYTDLSMVLGRRLKSPTSRIYCGGTQGGAGQPRRLREGRARTRSSPPATRCATRRAGTIPRRGRRTRRPSGSCSSRARRCRCTG